MKNQEKTNNQNINQLISENEPQLKAFIRKRVSNKADAEDILQDVFLQLVKTVDETLNPIEQVSAWLYRVTRNTIINRGKKKTEEELPIYSTDEGEEVLKDFAEFLFNEESPSPETEYMRSLVWDELELALSELPPEQKEAFELMEIDGLSAKEVAEATGVSVNTLLSRKHYATKHLRIRLKELYNELLSDE
ncbi:RNA polymerase sigma factor [Dysgonomonas capnocytophagoides]|uniref:RNA polymerase sigma factor n=1 Tax=Dysgonomonas capnocytophagoides TaxID=45254 RepID=A0A4Y8L0J3_9BACT|nr:RNA polymerase sigma factor [Dysgonomonas capnocytophagoides]TFD94704.1 RNA polymerase sigma factor [Dysgonomonas capnocytophagoides]